jgi:hypothetical protein
LQEKHEEGYCLADHLQTYNKITRD